MNKFELRDELLRRVTRLLEDVKPSVEEVDEPGVYDWAKQLTVAEDVWIVQTEFDLVIYSYENDAKDVAASFFENGRVVRHWNSSLVVKVLEILRHHMVLEDLSDV